ncbi:unnamed protein product [Effrenium voratum]|uniref:Sulfoacetaldehyde acetyltransferase n=1 Tax=Effrenium voratum TaxID=2562239 RepID=A0AA36HLF8_9DINO|nr:unnamed protein product [Effrenium voratum]
MWEGSWSCEQWRYFVDHAGDDQAKQPGQKHAIDGLQSAPPNAKIHFAPRHDKAKEDAKKEEEARKEEARKVEEKREEARREAEAAAERQRQEQRDKDRREEEKRKQEEEERDLARRREEDRNREREQEESRRREEDRREQQRKADEEERRLRERVSERERADQRGGFQEVEQMNMFKEGFALCSAPAQINIPRDYWTQVVELPLPTGVKLERTGGGKESTRRAAELLSEAKFPVILNGAGVILSGGTEQSVKLAERLGAPVCCNYQHNDAFPGDHPLHMGPLGYNGSKAAMEVMSKADVVLALGTRLNPFSTLPGYGMDYWPKDAKLIQEKKAAWASELESLDHELDDEGTTWNQRARQEAIMSSDIGNNCAIGNACPSFASPRKYLAPGLFGPCGYGFPAILGAKVGNPDVPVVGFAGDGAFGISVNEITACGRGDWPPVTMVVFRNFQWGAEKRNTTLWYDDNFVGTELNKGVEYAEMAKACGLKGVKVQSVEQLERALSSAIEGQMKRGETTLVEVLLNQELGEPFRRDAMKAPVQVAPINASDMAE